MSIGIEVKVWAHSTEWASKQCRHRSLLLSYPPLNARSTTRRSPCSTAKECSWIPIDCLSIYSWVDRCLGLVLVAHEH